MFPEINFVVDYVPLTTQHLIIVHGLCDDLNKGRYTGDIPDVLNDIVSHYAQFDFLYFYNLYVHNFSLDTGISFVLYVIDCLLDHFTKGLDNHARI